MYFIPRNNTFYNYIAHTNKKRRYCATFFIIVMFVVMGFYGIYMPLAAGIIFYTTERAHLKKQQAHNDELEKRNQELLVHIDTNKKSISENIVVDDAQADYCSQKMQFVFDAIAQSGLVLSSYGSCKGKDGLWYIKDSARLEAVGSLEHILTFLKIVKDSGHMITMSDIAITRMQEGMFQLRCDISIVVVKK